LGAHAGTKPAENSQADNYYGIKPRKAQSPPPQEKHKEKTSSYLKKNTRKKPRAGKVLHA
jgi:hypothetical protein